MSRKNRSLFKKIYMKLLMLPINLIAAAFSLLVVAGIRGIIAGRKLHTKLESLEKGNKR